MNLGHSIRKNISKYAWVLKTGIQNTLVYRFNFLVRCLFGLIPLSATLFLWKAIYSGQGNESGGAEIGGYTLAGMVTYYLLITIVDALTAVTDDDWQIASDIREGRISQFILKPINFLAYRVCLFIASRIIYITVAGVPLLILAWVLRDYLVAPKDWQTVGLFLISLTLSGMIQFLLSFTMALLAFWVLEVSTFIFILFAFEYLAGGHMFPVDILPGWAATALYLTPFPYQLFFPVSVYLGKELSIPLHYGLLIQCFWAAFFFFLATFVWKRGVRKYSAVGG
jgi:ABC-2 type transport system permease protein